MRKFVKYGKTFGVIFAASFVVSGINSAIVSNTGAPSIAHYSVTQDVAERIVGAFGSARFSGVVNKASAERSKTDLVIAVSSPERHAGS